MAQGLWLRGVSQGDYAWGTGVPTNAYWDSTQSTLTLVARVTLADWSPGAARGNYLVGCWQWSANEGYLLELATGGYLTFRWRETDTTLRSVATTSPVPFTPNSTYTVRGVLTKSTGAVVFEYRELDTDGWSPLAAGSAVGATSVRSVNEPVRIGSDGALNYSTIDSAKYVEVWDGATRLTHPAFDDSGEWSTTSTLETDVEGIDWRLSNYPFGVVIQVVGTSTETVTHSTDANLSGSVTVSHSTDADVGALSDDGVGPQPHVVSTWKSAKGYTPYRGLDGPATRYVSHDTNAWLLDDTPAFIVRQSHLRGPEADTLRSGATSVGSVSHATEATVRLTTDVTHETWSIVRDTAEVVHSTDATVFQGGVVTHGTEAELLATLEVSHSTNAETSDTATEVSHSTDASLLLEDSESHTSDTYLQSGVGAGVAQHTSDVIVGGVTAAFPAEMIFAAVLDPVTNSGFKTTVRMLKTGSDPYVDVTLKEGTQVIKTWRVSEVSETLSDYPLYLSEGEATPIQNFDDLHIELVVDNLDALEQLQVSNTQHQVSSEGPEAGSDALLESWTGAKGRVWGDFQYTGAYPVDPPEISPDFWEGLSFVDGIRKLREVTGFIFYVDSSGGAIWRAPNIWKAGNYVTFTGYAEDYVPEIDEEHVLMDYGVTIDDRSLRSRILVASEPDPELGIMYAEYQPGVFKKERLPGMEISDLEYLGGQERVMTVGGYPFQNQQEIKKFAYLTSLWIHWSLRKGSIRIPGVPAFEPDDQIRVFERVTGEVFTHYIMGVSSSMDLESGSWVMDLDTQWLGDDPEARWLVNRNDLDESPTLKAWLVASGLIDPDTGQPIEGLDNMSPLIYAGDPIRDEPLAITPDPPSSTSPDDFVIGGGDGDYLNRGSTAWAKYHWGDYEFESNAGQKLFKANHIVDYTFMQPWKSVYNQPAYDGLVPVNTHSSQTKLIQFQTNRWAVPVWDKLAELCRIYGIVVDHMGSTLSIRQRYNGKPPRLIPGTWSLHSWGIAIDINSSWSGWCLHCTPNANSLALGNAAVSRIRLGAGAPRFGPYDTKGFVNWGGNWSSDFLDPMHFQINASRQEIIDYGVLLLP